jgi:lipopolysaccharide transport system permease protein
MWPSALLFPLRHRALIATLSRRELASRYRASLLGGLWIALSPLIMLGVFAFVFSSILQARFPGQPDGGTAAYALVLFGGLSLATFFNEIAGRAPGAVLSHPNYVKKVVFPLPALAWVDVTVALPPLMVGLGIVTALLAANGQLPLSALALPLVVAPMLVLAVGIAWGLSALGVYLRDLGTLVPPMLTALVFLAPVMYPRESVPAGIRDWMVWNPLTIPVEQVRRVLFLGEWPEWTPLAAYAAAAMMVYFGGYAAFQRLKKGFADVL